MSEPGVSSPAEIYLAGFWDLVHQSREAQERGDEGGFDGIGYARAMMARERFLDATDRLAFAPGLSADELENVAAGILSLANENRLCHVPYAACRQPHVALTQTWRNS